MSEPGPGEVRVRVLTSGVGFADIMSLHGGYPFAPKGPFTPGYDFAGQVDRLGEGVREIPLGQWVVGLNPGFGCQADFVTVREDLLVPFPQSMDPAEAVSLVLNYLTAHCILYKKAQVRKGEKVLIHGAGGGVGTALLQLGSLLDLKMYGTASAQKHQTVERFGGIPIDYQTQDFVEFVRRAEPHGIDAIFDPVGGANLRKSYRLLRKGGRAVSYGFAGNKFGGLIPMILGVLQLGMLNLRPDGKRIYLVATPREMKKDMLWYRNTLAELVTMLQKGLIKPLVGKRINFDEAEKAYRMLADGEVEGKVVLVHQ